MRKSRKGIGLIWQKLPGQPGLLPTWISVAIGLALLLVGCGEPPGPVPAGPERGSPAAVTRPAGESGTAVRRDLAEDERRGGHTLSRHVGLSDDHLRARLRRETRISAASTWEDRDTAERIVAATLARERPRVTRWTAREGERPNLALDWIGRETLGRSLRRGARSVLRVSCAVVVVRWDTRDDDYFVLTSYPEACR